MIETRMVEIVKELQDMGLHKDVALLLTKIEKIDLLVLLSVTLECLSDKYGIETFQEDLERALHVDLEMAQANDEEDEEDENVVLIIKKKEKVNV
jgi:hypothetical protein